MKTDTTAKAIILICSALLICLLVYILWEASTLPSLPAEPVKGGVVGTLEMPEKLDVIATFEDVPYPLQGPNINLHGY